MYFSFLSGLFFIFYLAFGASIFSAIESPIEKQEMEELISKKTNFLQNHPCVAGKFCLASSQFARTPFETKLYTVFPHIVSVETIFF